MGVKVSSSNLIIICTPGSEDSYDKLYLKSIIPYYIYIRYYTKINLIMAFPVTDGQTLDLWYPEH